MVHTRSKSGNQHAGEATPGDKHQTEHKLPNSKRAKTVSAKQENKGESDVKGHLRRGSGNAKPGRREKTEPKDEGAVKPGEEPEVPSNILEKGIIYFFIRGRVGIDKPGDVSEIARTFIILRPIDKDAKLGEGPIGDAGNTRLIALPKKVLPVSGKDRFVTFVEKSAASFDTLKTSFLEGSDYETKTRGTHHTPPAVPVGEGVYAITKTGRESHLAYEITLPEKLEDVQKNLGVREQGSFIISTKNPTYKAPSYANLAENPEYPKEVMDEFRSLRWLPSNPKHLDYVNTQVLLVGESSGIEKAMRPQNTDQEEGSEEPGEALETLEKEDLARMRHLPGGPSASIFADLHAQAEGYPKLQTTF